MTSQVNAIRNNALFRQKFEAFCEKTSSLLKTKKTKNVLISQRIVLIPYTTKKSNSVHLWDFFTLKNKQKYLTLVKPKKFFLSFLLHHYVTYIFWKFIVVL
jgi:hypothetical protein